MHGQQNISLYWYTMMHGQQNISLYWYTMMHGQQNISLYWYIMMHGQQNIKFILKTLNDIFCVTNIKMSADRRNEVQQAVHRP
jgi:hypothetical protein